MTNVEAQKATPEWIVNTYSQRNWVEVFYREAKGNLGLREYTEALEAFRTAITYRFVKWLQENWDVFVAYKASFGYILA